MRLEPSLRDTASRSPDRAALICGPRRITYAHLDLAARRLAHALIDRGLPRGARVVIHLDNGPEAAASVFGVLMAGGVFVPAHPATRPDKLARILNDCRAHALVTSASRWAPLATPTPHLQTLALAGPGPLSEGAFSLDEALALGNDGAVPAPGSDADLAAVVYTSGSSGRPKGVMLSHLNLTSATASISSYLGITADDVILSVLPLSFTYGLSQLLLAVRAGATLVLERSFAYPQAVLQTIARERATGMPLVPTIASLLLQTDLSRHDLSSLRFITNAGAALPADHARRLRAFLPHAALFSMYGQTECVRVSYLPPDQLDARPGSAGRPMPNVEAYVVDDAGRPLPPGEVGELVVRGPNVMLGYWGDPHETQRRLRPGPLPGQHFLHTNDLFRADADGFLYFVSRTDDIIKSRGEKVSPREVEDVLHSHPAVAEAAVVGVPDPVLGEAVRAFVALLGGADASPRDLRRHCADRLEDFLVPQSVEILPALPRGDNGKVDRLCLKAARP